MQYSASKHHVVFEFAVTPAGTRATPIVEWTLHGMVMFPLPPIWMHEINIEHTIEVVE